jgi:aryl-alcohol dehydrogenase-like predicted oxidoreductase
VRALLALAEGHGVPASHVAIAWLKDQPGVTCPIIGVSHLAQFEDAVKAFDFNLTAEERSELAKAFNSEVKEVSQSYGPLRRSFELIAE